MSDDPLLPGPRPAGGLPASTATPRKPLERFAAEVVGVERPAADLVQLRLRLAPGGAFGFRPGQFTYVYLGRPDGETRRAYSIASPPAEVPFLDLCVKRVNPLGVSGWLYERRVGDRLEITRALGSFTFKSPEGRAVVFLATGTGVAPFRSILRDRLAGGDLRPFTLILGAGHPEGLPFHAEWQDLAARHANVRYEPTVTRAATFEWSGARGWVQEHYLRLFHGRTDVDVYICGVERMVEDAHRQLRGEGIPADQIHLERYV